MKIQGSEVKRYLKNVSVRYIYGKMLILTFEDSEEEILNHIVSYVSTGTKAFQVVENARTELRFDGLEIDVAKRLERQKVARKGSLFIYLVNLFAPDMVI